MKKKKLVVIAQTPPPHLGQSIMHKFLVDDQWEEIEKKHIRLELTKNSNQFGKVSSSKIIGIISVVIKLWKERFKGNIDILYYPPSGPVSRKTFYKDLSILLFTRFLAKKTVFHFHADKFNNLLNILSKVELFIAKMIYGEPDLCIVILDPQKSDVVWLNPKSIVVIPNGIEDVYSFRSIEKNKKTFCILYVGLLVQYKGIEDAVLASLYLKNKGLNFKWIFVGGWSSAEFERQIRTMINNYNLQENLIFVGEKIDKEKWEYFYTSDVLCLPTRNDLMPLCILEGMMMSLPIVSTTIRTIPFIVDEELNGLLSPVNDPRALAIRIESLINNQEKCQTLGTNARQKFENNYHISKHLQLMKFEVLNLIK